MCFGLLPPAIESDSFSHFKTPFKEVIPDPLVFIIIEVTGQCIQVVIDLFKGIFNERETWQAELETFQRANQQVWF